MDLQFVAEVSSNHHRDLDRCIRFIETSSDVGCAAVKFQLFRIDDLFAPEILATSAKHRRRRDWELPPELLSPLSQCARDLGMRFSCTPFYLDAVDQLYPYVDFYKIASYELLWHDLLTACAATGKPIVLSTGMATLSEIRAAVETVHVGGCRDLTLLHCVSGYPTPVSECNLAAMETLRDQFGCAVGWSDHSVSPAVVARAVHHWGATMIEFHLDLDGKGEEFEAGHCWLPGEIAAVVRSLKDGMQADGSGCKVPQASELPDRDWRADPTDGLRPLQHMRSNLSQRAAS